MKLIHKIAIVATGLILFAGVASSQNAGQVLTTLLGNELIQVQSQVNNTAAITYTTTANLRDGRMYLYNVPITGFTITLTVSQSAVSLNPAGTLSTGTIVFPATTFDGKTVSIYTTQTISTLTLSTTNSATFVPGAVTTLAANASVSYVYDLANNQWHRIS